MCGMSCVLKGLGEEGRLHRLLSAVTGWDTDEVARFLHACVDAPKVPLDDAGACVMEMRGPPNMSFAGVSKVIAAARSGGVSGFKERTLEEVAEIISVCNEDTVLGADDIRALQRIMRETPITIHDLQRMVLDCPSLSFLWALLAEVGLIHGPSTHIISHQCHDIRPGSEPLLPKLSALSRWRH